MNIEDVIKSCNFKLVASEVKNCWFGCNFWNNDDNIGCKENKIFKKKK